LKENIPYLFLNAAKADVFLYIALLYKNLSPIFISSNVTGGGSTTIISVFFDI